MTTPSNPNKSPDPHLTKDEDRASIAESNARSVLKIEQTVLAAIATLGLPTRETVEQLQTEIESIAQIFSSRLNCAISSGDWDTTMVVAPDAPNIKLPEWDRVLPELIQTGISAAKIADKLNELGFTNAVGTPIQRGLVQSQINRVLEWKMMYKRARWTSPSRWNSRRS